MMHLKRITLFKLNSPYTKAGTTCAGLLMFPQKSLYQLSHSKIASLLVMPTAEQWISLFLPHALFWHRTRGKARRFMRLPLCRREPREPSGCLNCPPCRYCGDRIPQPRRHFSSWRTRRIFGSACPSLISHRGASFGTS